MAIKQDVFPISELEGVLDKALADLQRLNDKIERNEWELLRLKVRSVAQVFSAFLFDGVLFVSQRGRILYADQTIQRLFDYSADELNQQSIEMLILPDRRKPAAHGREDFAYVEDFLMGAGFPLKLRGLRKDGTQFKIGLSLHAGNVEGVRVFCLICTPLE